MPELRRLRERAGLTLDEVADAMGVDASTVSRWETGRRRLYVELLRDLLALYGAGPHDACAILLDRS